MPRIFAPASRAGKRARSRGPLSLWLLSLAPGGGGLASLSPAGASRLVARLAGPAQ